MSVLALALAINFVVIIICIYRVGGSNISGKINYFHFTQYVECKFKGDKIFQIYQKVLFRGASN